VAVRGSSPFRHFLPKSFASCDEWRWWRANGDAIVDEPDVYESSRGDNEFGSDGHFDE